MFTKNKILIAVLVVVLVGVGVWLGQNLNKPSGDSASKYSVVAMANGEIFFGKLSWFPKLHLTNAWVLQQTRDENDQAQLGVVPLSSALWKPVSEIYLNPEQVVSWAKLSKDSQMVQAFENPTSLGQQGAGQPPVSTSTFQGPSANPPGQ